MSIVRWDPMKELEDMQRRFQSYFQTPTVGSFFNEQLASPQWMPACDIAETPEAYSIHAELPDVRKEDVKVTIADGVLTLMGERKMEKEEKNKRYHRVERSYGRFLRSFDLPTAVDENKVTATYRDGVLNLLVPKSTSGSAQPKEVRIG
ncbi:MAG: heat-shock protein Hsp20 [Deltaproteobacteria bacterium RBG_16_71_12]|nr:MAG: heat-shock protein Hsp20 [Deltaproteobacteria bacterium RBG_16_71_12]OGW99018.1 MAG: heat-shock protein Hsp20 [Nitrospirae bacterium RIFCSPLOWO2_12_FULL_63_8]